MARSNDKWCEGQHKAKYARIVHISKSLYSCLLIVKRPPKYVINIIIVSLFGR